MFDRIPTFRRVMLTPFWEYREMLYGDREFFFWQIICNIIMLMPFGFLMPVISGISGWKVILTGCFLSISIELIQYVSACGLCEFDDVFNNTLGTAIGYLIYKITIGVRRKSTVK